MLAFYAQRVYSICCLLICYFHFFCRMRSHNLRWAHHTNAHFNNAHTYVLNALRRSHFRTRKLNTFSLFFFSQRRTIINLSYNISKHSKCFILPHMAHICAWMYSILESKCIDSTRSSSFSLFLCRSVVKIVSVQLKSKCAINIFMHIVDKCTLRMVQLSSLWCCRHHHHHYHYDYYNRHYLITNIEWIVALVLRTHTMK